eukprot:s213_g6.t1
MFGMSLEFTINFRLVSCHRQVSTRWTEGLTTSAEAASSNSEKAFVSLRELTASISTLEHSITSLTTDIKMLQDTQDQMTSIREEESSKYQEEVELNTQSAKSVEGALSKLSAGTSFLQRRADEPDKGYVVGLLKGIQDRLTKTRTELDQTEKAKTLTHKSLFSAKKDQATILQNEVLQKSHLLAQSKLDLVEAQRVHDEEKDRYEFFESSAEMMQMVADTKEDCSSKASEFEVRKEDQQKERAALVEATAVLKEEESDNTATNFLQVASESNAKGEEKEDALRRAVALMQHQTHDKAEGMGKAAEAVLGLVDAIQSHQEEDAKRKDFCEIQMGNNKDSKAKIEGDLVRLKAREAFLESEVGTTSKEVEELKAEAKTFTDRLKKLEESTKDRELTVQVVKKAKGIVESFYQTKDPQGLVQVHDHKVDASDEPKKDQPLGQYLCLSRWDFQKEQKDAEKAEKKADDSLDKIREDTTKLFDKKLAHVSRLLQEKARNAEELTQVKADSDLKTTALTATSGALSKLEKECTDLLANFQKVEKERKRQIWQLKDVADILSGATVGARTGVTAGLLALEKSVQFPSLTRQKDVSCDFAILADGTLFAAPHNPTMKALLERYTQSHTLTEVDEDGEHPLFPQSRSRGRGEQRLGHAAGGGDLHAVLAREPQSSLKDLAPVARVLHKIDTEQLTHIKDVFMRLGDALNLKDFLDTLLPHVRNMEGGEEQAIVALEMLHHQMTEGDEEEEEAEVKPEVKTEVEEGNQAFLTETQMGEEETEKLVSWDMLANVLLDEGVVANVVSGFNVTQVLSVLDLDKITPLQAIFEKEGTVDLESFVVILQGQFQHVFELIHLFQLYEDERRIITQLVNLFDTIDVDCTGNLTWEEFTAFLVDQGMAEDVPQQYNIIRFHQSPLKDGNGHQSHCEKVSYLKGYDKIAFVEQGSKVLKMCTPDMQPYTEIKDFTQSPLCAEYIDKSAGIRSSYLDENIAAITTASARLDRALATKRMKPLRPSEKMDIINQVRDGRPLGAGTAELSRAVLERDINVSGKVGFEEFNEGCHQLLAECDRWCHKVCGHPGDPCLFGDITELLESPWFRDDMTYSQKLSSGRDTRMVDTMPCMLHGERCGIQKKPVFDVSGLPCPDMSQCGKRLKRAGATNSVYIAHGRWVTDNKTPLLLVECTPEAWKQ